MATNLESTAALNKMIQEQNQLYLQQVKILRGQAQLLEKMVKTTQDVDPSKITNNMEELSRQTKTAIEQIEEYGGISKTQFGIASKATNTLNKKIDDSSKLLKKAGKAGMAIGAVGGVIAKVAQSFNVLGSAVSGVFGILGEVFGLIKNLSISIITAPFKILDALIANVGAGSSEFRQALEDIRKEFGDLRTGSSRAILDISRNMQGQLAQTGLSTYRIFGNIAEKLRTITEYAQKLGPLFTNLSNSLVANAEAFGAYVKGLGLTDEGMKGVGRQALIFGKTFTEVGREITSMAYQLGPAFGINGKEISRAIGDMINDVKNFGSLSVKQLGQIAVYTRKLGLEFKDLLGIIDKFDNFEDAANSVAQLTQAFGLNIDAFELMMDQDPASRFEKIRKAFYQTGRSVENMSRQELKLLASQTGLTEEAVKLGFSMRSQGMTYDQVQKKASIAEKKQLSQAEAMEKLANSIERLVKSGDIGQGGFFDRFIQGFMKGVQWSREFRMMMYSLRRVLMIVYYEGMRVGRDFVKFFPGFKDVLKGIRELFNPRMWRRSMDSLRAVFRTFFKNIGNDPANAVKNLLEGIQRIFVGHFKESGGAAQKVINGFKDFIRAMIRGGTQLIIQGVNGLVDLIKNILTGGIGGRLTDSAGQALTGFSKFIVEEFNYIGQAVKDSKLFDKVVELFHLIIKGVQRFFKSEAGQKLISGFNDLIAAIKPPLIKAFKELAKEIGKAFLKGIGDTLLDWSGISAAQAESMAESYRETATEIVRISRSGAQGVERAATFESFQKHRKATENANENALEQYKNRVEALHKAAQSSSGNWNRIYTAQWQSADREYKSFQARIASQTEHFNRIQQARFGQAQTQAQDTARSIIELGAAYEEYQESLPSTVITPPTVVGPRQTDTDYLRAPNQTVNAEGIQRTIASQSEAIEAVEEFNRIKNIRLPSPAQLTKFADRMSAFLSIWKTNIADALVGFSTGWKDSIIKASTDLVALVNQVTTDMNKITSQPHQVNVRLKELANHLGMKGTQTLEVKNRNFQFNITVNVTVDSEEFEDTLLKRTDTRIVHTDVGVPWTEWGTGR